jgi:hypothetical protein
MTFLHDDSSAVVERTQRYMGFPIKIIDFFDWKMRVLTKWGLPTGKNDGA